VALSIDVWVLDIVLLVLVPAVVGILLTRWIRERAKRAGSSPAQVRGLEILVTVIWVALVLIGTSVTLGPISLLSTITFSAVTGIAVTLALQTTLQNFVSGVILLQHRAIRIGDVIQFGGVKGEVVSFGLVTTVVKQEDGTLVFVSNSNLLGGPLVNYTAAKRLEGEY
jgi:small-conductance mechanosensitive channel